MSDLMDNQIQKQLDDLFLFERKLYKLLEDKDYEQFQEQQQLFSYDLKKLLDHNSKEILSINIALLKELKDKVNRLKVKSNDSFKLLREKSLKQRRNQKNIQAYKK